jgi:nucleolar protein 56
MLKDREFDSVERISPSVEKFIQINKLNIYLQSNSFANEREIIDKLRDFSLKLSSLRIQEASEQMDLHISQSINALDEIDKISNTLGTRMREWYGLHFPELDNLLQNANTYSLLVSNCGKRDNITKEFLETIDIPENKIEIITEVSKRSRGGKITEQNLLIVQNIAQQVISLNKIRKNLEDHIDASMEDVAPNVKGLLTASVGARLISKAGSLRRLASLSASTIQILGAEKALFRTLKTGSDPPKHGILFQHPVIHSAPKWQRGKMARAIAAKTAIAARLDVYGQNPEVNQALSDKLTDRLTEIKEKYKEPPAIEQRKSSSRNERRFGSNPNFRGKSNDNWKGKGKNNDKYKKNKFKKRHHKSNKK